jgi:hypothetical protein
MPIPVIDLFAGPGGLGERFSGSFRMWRRRMRTPRAPGAAQPHCGRDWIRRPAMSKIDDDAHSV